jgi:hypothetical protein
MNQNPNMQVGVPQYVPPQDSNNNFIMPPQAFIVMNGQTKTGNNEQNKFKVQQ